MKRAYVILIQSDDDFDKAPVDRTVDEFFNGPLVDVLEKLGVDGSCDLTSGDATVNTSPIAAPDHVPSFTVRTLGED